MKETTKAFKNAIIDQFDGHLKTAGFKKIRHRAEKYGFAVIYRCGERYISFNASLHPTDYPAFYSISFGEGSIDFPESDWNAIDLLQIVKSNSLQDFERYRETFIIAHTISKDEIAQKINTARKLLEKHGKPFLNNDLDQFRKLRAEQNKDREPYKRYIPKRDGSYNMEYEKQSQELKKKYSE